MTLAKQLVIPAGAGLQRVVVLWRDLPERIAYAQSRTLYRRGFVNFIDMLAGQRTWNDSRQDLANAERDVSLEVVNLYTALGATTVLEP